MKKSSDTHLQIIFIIALMTVVFLLFSGSLEREWHYDDYHHIKENPSIRKLGNIPKFFSDSATFSRNPSHRSYRPLHMATLCINYWIANVLYGDGTDVRIYNATNLLLHLLASMMVFFAITAIVPLLSPTPCIKPFLPGMAGAVLFALHPVNAESVLYISSRSSILTSLLAFTSFFLYLKSIESGGVRRGLFIASINFYILAILSKEIAIILPVMIFFFEAVRAREENSGRPWRGISWRILPFAAAGSICFLLFQAMTGTHILKHMLSTGGPQQAPNLSSQLATQAKVWVIYTREWLFPTSLSLDRAVSISRSFLEPKTVLSLVLICSLVFLSFRSRKRYPLLTLGVLWFLTALIPSSIFRLIMTHNDNRLYLSGLGAAMVAAQIAMAGGGKITKGGRPLNPVGAMAVISVPLLLGILTFARTKVYSTEITLWSDVLRHNPQSRVALQALSAHLEAKSDYSARAEYLKRLLAIDPLNPEHLVNAAVLEFDRGNPSVALTYLLEAEKLSPEAERVQHNLGRVYIRLGNFSASENAFRKALLLNPRNVEAFFELGRLYFQQNRMELAEQNLRKSLELDPTGQGEANYFLGYILEDRGAFSEAIAAYRSYLRGGRGDPMTNGIAVERIRQLEGME